ERGSGRGENGAGRGAPPRVAAHALRLEVGGRGVELHCDTCELVVTHLAGPEVRRAVEEAHRRHLGTITWESGWFAVCSCGWSSTKVSQDKAWQELADHEASMLRPAAQGAPIPPPRPPKPA
ncbi:MAG TPA: hypothetical protein VK848_11870, partial [Acidimicrobiia bacterium]|nr:hypothetical protein [Acidimicrobiia bacterium]